jgi:hypothetical protein
MAFNKVYLQLFYIAILDDFIAHGAKGRIDAIDDASRAQFLFEECARRRAANKGVRRDCDLFVANAHGNDIFDG